MGLRFVSISVEQAAKTKAQQAKNVIILISLANLMLTVKN
jgi:hypothetical protein